MHDTGPLRPRNRTSGEPGLPLTRAPGEHAPLADDAERHYVGAQAVFGAWAAMDLAAAKAALIERCLGVNSVEAHDARRRATQLHAALIATLHRSPGVRSG